MLDERQKQILKAIVDDYVETSEPVGSKSLVARHRFKLSSATIRNEMATLEEQGYLEQPHTSAGRIPSDEGYRLYVSELMNQPEITGSTASMIRAYLRSNLNEAIDLIHKAVDVLAMQTNFTAMMLTPRYGAAQLAQIKILMIEPGKALIVMVLSAGVVKDRVIRISDLIEREQLTALANALEQGLSGRCLEEISLITVTKAAEDVELPEALLNQVLYETYTSIKQAENLEVYMRGTHSLLEQPEFQDVRKARRFLDTLKAEGLVAGYLSEMDASDRLRAREDKPAYVVRIGQEVALDGFEDLSFITTTYRINRCLSGRIGVIGPKRMKYSNIISQISFITQAISDEAKMLLPGECEMEDQK